MSMSVNSLQSHMSKLSMVGFTGDPNMDLRADLVNFHNYSVESASKLSESELYSIMDGFDSEESKTYSNEYGIKCSVCGSVVGLEFYDNPDDHYETVCKCGHTDHISPYYLDELEEQKEWEQTACDIVKNIHKNYVFVRVPNSLIETVRKGEHIQTLPSGGCYESEYWKYDNRFYAIQYNGECISKCIKRE